MFNLLVANADANRSCHALGRCFGKHKNLQRRVKGGWGNPIINAYKDYYFVLAMENSKHPGYVTEKILNAFAAGSIPIYWGDKIVKQFFNKDAFIDISDFPSLEDAAKYVCSMSMEKIRWMMEQPIINEENDIINMHRPGNQYHLNIAKKITDLLC